MYQDWEYSQEFDAEGAVVPPPPPPGSPPMHKPDVSAAPATAAKAEEAPTTAAATAAATPVVAGVVASEKHHGLRVPSGGIFRAMSAAVKHTPAGPASREVSITTPATSAFARGAAAAAAAAAVAEPAPAPAPAPAQTPTQSVAPAAQPPPLLSPRPSVVIEEVSGMCFSGIPAKALTPRMASGAGAQSGVVGASGRERGRARRSSGTASAAAGAMQGGSGGAQGLQAAAEPTHSVSAAMGVPSVVIAPVVTADEQVRLVCTHAHLSSNFPACLPAFSMCYALGMR